MAPAPPLPFGCRSDMFFDAQTRHAKLTVLGIGWHRNRKRKSSPFYNQIMGKKKKKRKRTYQQSGIVPPKSLERLAKEKEQQSEKAIITAIIDFTFQIQPQHLAFPGTSGASHGLHLLINGKQRGLEILQVFPADSPMNFPMGIVQQHHWKNMKTYGKNMNKHI